MYRKLDPLHIVGTLERLEHRINERFPGAGLGKVCAELTEIARENRSRVAALERPNIALRLASSAIIVAGIAFFTWVLSKVGVEVKRGEGESLLGLVQGVEALANTTVLVGAGVLFLVTLESRWKRTQALADLHELRSIIHVIDMHQLTKDPSTIASAGAATPSSPERQLSPFELMRYLDYCTEMLSLSAKVAVLYAQSSRDPIVIEASSDLGQITANLSQEIWQKIALVEASVQHAAQGPAQAARRADGQTAPAGHPQGPLQNGS